MNTKQIDPITGEELTHVAKLARGNFYSLRGKVFSPDTWTPITDREFDHLGPLTEAVLSPGFDEQWDDEDSRVEQIPIFIFALNDGNQTNADELTRERNAADAKERLIAERRRSARRGRT